LTSNIFFQNGDRFSDLLGIKCAKLYYADLALLLYDV